MTNKAKFSLTHNYFLPSPSLFLSSMASIPQFYPNYQFSPDEFSEITSVMAQENYTSATFSSTGAILGEDNNNNHLPILFDNGGLDIFPRDSDITSPVPVTSFPDRLGISDMAVPTLMDYKLGSNTGIAKFQNSGGGFQLSDVCEFREECCGLVPNYQPVCPAAGENWVSIFFLDS